MKKIMIAIIGIALIVVGNAGISQAATLWANSAGDDLSSFDVATGNQISGYTTGLGNGRGVVQVGNTLYVTVANTNVVSKIDATTGLSLGTAFTVAGATGLATMAYDGTNFWIGDYSGTNNAYKYSPTGTLLNTVSFVNCEGYCDGLEYFNGKLISNRYDGGYARGGGNQYDIYDLSGTLLTADFIDTNGHGNGTGIAFDGTNFFVSDIFNNQISVWDGTTGAFIRDIVLQNSHSYVEDLTVDYAQRIDTGKVPEPSTLLLLGLGVAGIFALRRRFSSVN